MHKIKNILRRLKNWLQWALTCKGEILAEMINDELIDLSGQGRDEYGR